MSQRTCTVVEVTDRGGWYLFLSRQEYGELTPSEADCFGPFGSEKETRRYLRDHFGNPWIAIYKDRTYAQLSKDLQALMDQAKNRRPTLGQPWMRG